SRSIRSAPRRTERGRRRRSRASLPQSRLLLLALVRAVVGGAERRDERLRRDLHRADVLHALLAGLLLLEELALTRNVAAVALGEHVLADRANRLPRDDARADRGLDGHLELLAVDEVL